MTTLEVAPPQGQVQRQATAPATRPPQQLPVRIHIRLLQVSVGSLLLFPGVLTITGGLRSLGIPAQIAGLVCLMVWGFERGIGASTLARGRQPVHWIIGLLVAGLLSSFAVAMARPLAPLEVSGANRALLMFASVIGVCLLAADAIKGRTDLMRIVHTLLYCGYFSGFAGLVQRYLHYDYTSFVARFPLVAYNSTVFSAERAGVRASGTASHPIEFGVVCGALLPLAFVAARHADSKNLRWRHYAGASLLAFAALISVSRSGALAILISGLVFAAVLNGRERVNLLGSTMALLASVQILAHGVLSTLRYLLLAGNADPSVKGRTADYAAVEPLVEHHFFGGIGLGTYRPQVYRYLDNQYLGTQIEAGFIGLVALICLFIAFATLCRSARRQSQARVDREMAQALFAGVLVMAVTAAFFDEFAFRQATTVLFLTVGLAGALWRLTRAPDPGGDEC